MDAILTTNITAHIFNIFTQNHCEAMLLVMYSVVVIWCALLVIIFATSVYDNVSISVVVTPGEYMTPFAVTTANINAPNKAMMAAIIITFMLLFILNITLCSAAIQSGAFLRMQNKCHFELSAGAIC